MMDADLQHDETQFTHDIISSLPKVRRPNAELRTREYLTEAEVEKLRFFRAAF
jgi:hypothetical protein